MMDRAHVHDRRRPRLRGVIAGEFAEWSFRQRGLAHRQEMTFEHELGVRRDRKAGHRPGMDLDRRTLDGAGEFVFRLPRGQIFKAGDEQRRILAIDDRERTGFALVPVFLGDDGAVPAGMVELHGDLVPAVHLKAVDRGIDPAAVRMAHDHDRARADEGAAVVAVPDRRRKLGEVDVLVPDRVLQESGVLDDGGRARLQRLALLHPGLERVERPQCRIDAERERSPLRAGGGVGEDAKAARKALDAVEQKCRAIGPPRRHLGDCADLEARVRALDASQPAELVDELDEFAQVLVHSVRPCRARCVRRIAACAPCGQARFLAILCHPDGSRRTKIMAKLRHIALIVPDPEKAAKFFEDAFDMKVAGKARRGLYVSDGTVNVALLKQEGNEKVGIYHFGMWVDDLDEAEKKVVGAGGKYLAGRPEPASAGETAHSYYEAKYKDPLGIVFDLTHTGWVGAVKDVVAAKN